MKILILSHLWEPEEGSPQRRWSWLTNALLDVGHDVTVICPPPHYPVGRLLSTKPQHQKWAKERVSSRFQIHRTTFRVHDPSLRSRIMNEIVSTGSLTVVALRHCWRDRPHVVVATCPPIPVMFAQRVVSSVFRLPAILDLRDAWPDLLDYVLISEIETSPTIRRSRMKTFVFSQVTRMTTLAVRHTMRKAQAITVTSRNFAHQLRAQLPQPVEVIYNLGVRHETLTPRQSNPNEPLRIVYAGTVGRAQRLQTALDAVRMLRDDGVLVTMRIIGGGAHLNTLKKNATKLSLPVEFVPRQPYTDIFSHYEWADTVLVMLQPWTPLEATIPSKLIEALSLSRHITVSANGEAAEIVTEAQQGHAVPAGDASALAHLWRSLAHDRSLLQVDGRAEQWKTRFGSRSDQVAKLLELIHRVIQESRV